MSLKEWTAFYWGKNISGEENLQIHRPERLRKTVWLKSRHRRRDRSPWVDEVLWCYYLSQLPHLKLKVGVAVQWGEREKMHPCLQGSLSSTFKPQTAVWLHVCSLPFYPGIETSSVRMGLGARGRWGRSFGLVWLGLEAKGWGHRPGRRGGAHLSGHCEGDILVAMMCLLGFVPVLLGESHRKLHLILHTKLINSWIYCIFEWTALH